MANCSVCGKALTMFNKADASTCSACGTAERERQRARAANPLRVDDNTGTTAAAQLQTRKANIEAIVVTTEMQPDINIEQRMGIITAECAYGMNIFKDLFSSIRNIVGGRSEAVQKTMRDARETVLYELKREADLLGANAVVGVDLDYVQIGGNGWSMIMLVATGTAVRTAKP